MNQTSPKPPPNRRIKTCKNTLILLTTFYCNCKILKKKIYIQTYITKQQQQQTTTNKKNINTTRRKDKKNTTPINQQPCLELSKSPPPLIQITKCGAV